MTVRGMMDQTWLNHVTQLKSGYYPVVSEEIRCSGLSINLGMVSQNDVCEISTPYVKCNNSYELERMMGQTGLRLSNDKFIHKGIL